MSPRRGARPNPRAREAERLVQKAAALWRAHRFDESLKVYGEAVRDYGSFPEVLLQAAQAYFARRRLDKSLPLLDRAMRLGSDRADILCGVGEAYRRHGDFSAAERCFRRALFVVDDAPRAELELAHLCERTQRLEEGLELCGRLLRRDPRCGPALVIASRIHRRQERWLEAEKDLRAWLRAAEDSAFVAEGWGELALLYDATSRYDEAWEAIERGKRIYLERDSAARHAAEHVAERFAKMVQALTPRHLTDWRVGEANAVPSPVALLCGFPRSGTTLLEQVLDAHPGLVSMEEQDILAAEIFPHLSRDSFRAPVESLLDTWNDQERAAAAEDYLRLARHTIDAPSDALILDKNPALTLMIPVFLRLFPAAKILVALRDPRDVVVSCYLRYLPLNPVSVCFLTPERTARRYTADMQGWLRFRELLPDNWLEVRYEDTVADLERVARRAVDHLGLGWTDMIMSYRDRVGVKGVRSPTYEAVARPVYDRSIGRWRNYARQIAPLQELLAPVAEALGYPTS